MGCILSFFKSRDEYDQLKYRRKLSLSRKNGSMLSDTTDDESFDQPLTSDDSESTISIGRIKKHVRFAL